MAGQGEIAGGREGAISTTENGDMHGNPGKPIGRVLSPHVQAKIDRQRTANPVLCGAAHRFNLAKKMRQGVIECIGLINLPHMSTPLQGYETRIRQAACELDCEKPGIASFNSIDYDDRLIVASLF
jgi:hypothetical protein